MDGEHSGRLCLLGNRAHHAMRGIDRHGYRRITGPSFDIATSVDPRCAAQDRGVAQMCRSERVLGFGVIGARRTNSAHRHRPWRASLMANLKVTATTTRAVLADGIPGVRR